MTNEVTEQKRSLFRESKSFISRVVDHDTFVPLGHFFPPSVTPAMVIHWPPSLTHKPKYGTNATEMSITAPVQFKNGPAGFRAIRGQEMLVIKRGNGDCARPSNDHRYSALLVFKSIEAMLCSSVGCGRLPH